MKTILVATDFSPAATNALNYAMDMASVLGFNLHLLHVCSISAPISEVPLRISPEQQTDEALLQLNNLKVELKQKVNFNTEITTEMRLGDFFDELKASCEQMQPFAVVMGSQGTTAAERFLFGSHTIHAMKHLEWPLITVPADAHFTSIRKIGFACDMEHIADSFPVEELKELVHDTKAELFILNTGKKNKFNPDVVFESRILMYKLSELKPTYHFIASDKINKGILDFAEKNNIDLLLVLPKQHDLLDQLVHTSVTKKLILHSHVPVMALHEVETTGNHH